MVVRTRTKICRYCKHCDYNAAKKWCSYWRSEIKPLMLATGCSKWEQND